MEQLGLQVEQERIVAAARVAVQIELRHQKRRHSSLNTPLFSIRAL